jgi:dynein light intermediate chain 1
MDNVGDEMGMKGGGWEERTDWIQQVIRTVCLSYGAALIYTAPTQPQTYTLLRDYLYHRLYTVPPSLNSDAVSLAAPAAAAPTRFPFPHRANVLDRDAVLVPSGWDSWGKINVLRDGFDPARVARAWDASAARHARAAANPSDDTMEDDGEGEGIEDLWVAMVPDTERPAAPNASAVTTTFEAEQAFLQRQLDTLLKDPNRDARAAFRHAANSATAVGGKDAKDGSLGAPGSAGAAALSPGEERFAGVVGPMGSGGLSLPGVEKAMAEMEGEDAKDRFARITRRVCFFFIIIISFHGMTWHSADTPPGLDKAHVADRYG